MKIHMSRWGLLLTAVCALVGWPRVLKAEAEMTWHEPMGEAAVQATDGPRLSLAIHPGMVQVGELFSLKIEYHFIGQPDTSVFMDYPELVVYDPPLEMPCGFYTHTNRCSEITMRAMSSGVETFTAAAYGEAWDSLCNCSWWTSAFDDGAVRVVIVDQVWRLRLPTIWR